MHVEPAKTPNYRVLYMTSHIICYFVFLMNDEIFKFSYLTNKPYAFYAITALYFISLNLYAASCQNPGFSDKDAEKPAEGKDLYFCEICKAYCPVRACHCRDCGRCVLRRDHHCPWTGCCIGRDNHVYFYLYVYTEAIGDLFCLFCCLRQMWFTPFNNFGGYLTATWKSIFLIPWAVLGAVNGIGLIYQHTTLISKNVTVWEHHRWGRISYLQGRPYLKSPFNKGVIENFIEFFTMKALKKEWQIPAQPSLEEMRDT